MKVMALDYGDARTGVAFSDPLGLLAGETAVLSSWNHERLLEEVTALAESRGVDTVVLGLPRNMDGSEGPRAEKSRAFAAELEERGWRVVLVDERRTTVEAHGILTETGRHGKGRKQRIDAVAATLILETYLNSLKR
ncbi:MAG: Holliday junction resolvase RuvX [Oscillospiraceae bacterium]|nr:Holliday junction resolvase RuvX [Oscillospiraceae bacterium]